MKPSYLSVTGASFIDSQLLDISKTSTTLTYCLIINERYNYSTIRIGNKNYNNNIFRDINQMNLELDLF